MAFHVFVGWRSHYEGHQSKEATKEFKIFFIGIVTTIVYKATWKAMKKKAFIWLLCLPTFLHLRMRPKVHRFSSAMRRRIRFFTCCGNTSWTKKFDLAFEESRSLLSSMTANICFKMLMKSSVNHFPSTEFSRDLWKQASRTWVGGKWLAVRHRWSYSQGCKRSSGEQRWEQRWIPKPERLKPELTNIEKILPQVKKDTCMKFIP